MIKTWRVPGSVSDDDFVWLKKICDRADFDWQTEPWNRWPMMPVDMYSQSNMICKTSSSRQESLLLLRFSNIELISSVLEN